MATPLISLYRVSDLSVLWAEFYITTRQKHEIRLRRESGPLARPGRCCSVINWGTFVRQNNGEGGDKTRRSCTANRNTFVQNLLCKATTVHPPPDLTLSNTSLYQRLLCTATSEQTGQHNATDKSLHGCDYKSTVL